jgi:hypothetical protein
MTRSWLSAVEWSLPIASAAVATAVSKPNLAHDHAVVALGR